MIYQNSISNVSWYLLSHSLYLLKTQRALLNDKDDIRSINATIIINSAAVAEGALLSHFNKNLHSHPQYSKSGSKNDFMIRALFDFPKEEIESRGFDQKVRIYERLMNVNINKLKNFKAISALMQFRNVLAHGGILTYSQKSVDNWVSGGDIKFENRTLLMDETTTWTKSKLISFLTENKLIKKGKKNMEMDGAFQK